MKQKYKLQTLQIKLQRNNFHSGGFTSNAKGQLHVLGHDGHPPGVDGAQVGVLEQRHQVGLRSLLQGADSRRLKPQVDLERLGDLLDEPLEGQFADEQLARLLKLSDLAQGDGAGTVAVRFLHLRRGN